MLLADHPYPPGMNKARILFLAQRRALKGESDKEESSGDVLVAEKGAIFEGSLALGQSSGLKDKGTSLKRMRSEVPEGSRRRPLQVDPSVASGKQDSVASEGTEVMEIISGRGVAAPQKGLSFPKTAGGEGVEKCTLLRFQTGLGWLGKSPGPSAPLSALGAFELSPDQKRLDSQQDEEVISSAKDALGVVCLLLVR